jgi:hypothetical protein
MIAARFEAAPRADRARGGLPFRGLPFKEVNRENMPVWPIRRSGAPARASRDLRGPDVMKVKHRIAWQRLLGGGRNQRSDDMDPWDLSIALFGSLTVGFFGASVLFAMIG